jgi:hypothetical protein
MSLKRLRRRPVQKNRVISAQALALGEMGCDRDFGSGEFKLINGILVHLGIFFVLVHMCRVELFHECDISAISLDTP